MGVCPRGHSRGQEKLDTEIRFTPPDGYAIELARQEDACDDSPVANPTTANQCTANAKAVHGGCSRALTGSPRRHSYPSTDSSFQNDREPPAERTEGSGRPSACGLRICVRKQADVPYCSRTAGRRRPDRNPARPYLWLRADKENRLPAAGKHTAYQAAGFCRARC